MTSVVPEASTTTPDSRDPHTPTALYRLYNTAGTLLYIGVTDNPDRRFKQHRDTKPWWPQVAKTTVEWHPSRDRALAEEATAIKAETSVYNIDHNPAAPSYHWPPAGMPTDQVDVIEREASRLPADHAEGIRRAAWEAFTRARLAEPTSTPTDPTEAVQALTAKHGTPISDETASHIRNAVHEAMRATLPHRYTPELAAQIAATTIGILTGTICPEYPGVCTDTEPGHFDHFNHEHSVTNKDGEHILDVGFVQLSDGGPAAIYIGGMHHEDLRPEEVRAKTAELRRLLDQADEMADKVIAMTAVHAEKPAARA